VSSAGGVQSIVTATETSPFTGVRNPRGFHHNPLVYLERTLMQSLKAAFRDAVRHIGLSSLVASGLGCSGALADGIMVERIQLGKAAQMVASPRQEALLIRDGDEIQVTLRTSFRAGPKELAWVVPVPHKPDSVQKADDGIFAKLEAVTAPRFEQFVVKRGFTIGCSAGGSMSSELVGRVAVTETGKAGIYDYTVLTATGTTALSQWLSDHGYNVPAGSEPIFKQYVDQGWCWLAIRLDAQRANGEILAPHPIRYTYRDSRCVYPLVISRLSADESNEVLLYILSYGYHGCENWANRIIESKQLVLESGTPSGTNYERLFQELTCQEEGHLFVPEFANNLNTVGYRPLLEELTGEDPLQKWPEDMGAFYLTRLRAVIPREAMDRDVILVHKGLGRYNWIDSHHRLTSSRMSMTGADVIIVIGLLLVACFVIRRRMKRRHFASPPPAV
jgi:hypothetical protein